MHTERVVAIAADYADALLVFRRAKRTLLLLLVVMLLAQIAIFATAHFAPQLLRIEPTSEFAAASSTTQPATANWTHLLQYGTVATLWLSMIAAVLLLVTLFATIHVMLVGRLIGVAYVARAFTLAAVVLLLLIPWQSLLVTLEMNVGEPVLPGVMYSWNEIRNHVPLAANADGAHMALYWGRFVAFPLVALVMLLVIQVRSGRGLKLALGEEELLPADDDLAVTRVR